MALPVVRVQKLSWFGQIMEAIDARIGEPHGFTVKAPTIKVGQLLPVVLLVLIQVIVIGTYYIIKRFCVRPLWLRSPKNEAHTNKASFHVEFCADISFD